MRLISELGESDLGVLRRPEGPPHFRIVLPPTSDSSAIEFLATDLSTFDVSAIELFATDLPHTELPDQETGRLS